MDGRRRRSCRGGRRLRDGTAGSSQKLITGEAEPFDVVGRNPHIVLGRTGIVAGGLQEDQLGIDKEEDGGMLDVLRRVALDYK